MKRIKQAGITLLELLLALVIIAAVLLAVARLYQVVENNYKVNEGSNIVLTVYQAAAQYTALPTTGNLLVDFYDKGYVPQQFITTGSNPWGGNITASAPTADQLDVKLEEVPSKLCLNLQQKFIKMNSVTTSCSAPSSTDTSTFEAQFFLDGS